MMVGESRDAFTKRVLGNKHLAVSRVKMQGDHSPPSCTPAFDVPDSK